ncbi:MAG: CRISPR-associated protein Cas4 [Polyangiaceae bacterium]|nr:CRISPR-associated protein Cas4 [Polyangiaceae bacterium]
MLSEADDFLPLSALQHLLYCERQAALIHIERAWREDGATAEGRVFHERADLPGGEVRHGVRTARAVPLRSARLRLHGRADVVEYHRDDSNPGAPRRPVPVEYKRGRVKELLADRVQLCAQAMCLEEMHGVVVGRGALFYGASHRRVEVQIDDELRRVTEEAARRLHELFGAGVVPRAEPGPKCRRCSLEPICLPEVTSGAGRESAYLSRLVSAPEEIE